MYADNTLTPKEAIRLCALGTLTSGPLRYGELVTSVRHFVSHILGPSLEMMGTSIELLKYEGLIEARDGVGMEDDAVLEITPVGREALNDLLTTNIRAAATELNKLIIALKFRFLHLLDAEEQRIQADLLIDVCENELARLDELQTHHSADEGYLGAWLNHDIKMLEGNLAWLEAFRDKI